MFANFLWEIVVACGWLKAAKAMPGRQADRQTDRETDKETDGETERQTDALAGAILELGENLCDVFFELLLQNFSDTCSR